MGLTAAFEIYRKHTDTQTLYSNYSFIMETCEALMKNEK